MAAQSKAPAESSNKEPRSATRPSKGAVSPWRGRGQSPSGIFKGRALKQGVGQSPTRRVSDDPALHKSTKKEQENKAVFLLFLMWVKYMQRRQSVGIAVSGTASKASAFRPAAQYCVSTTLPQLPFSPSGKSLRFFLRVQKDSFSGGVSLKDTLSPYNVYE